MHFNMEMLGHDKTKRYVDKYTENAYKYNIYEC